MNIARVRHLFYPDMPRDFFYELSARQADRGYQVDVLTWKKNGSFSEELATAGFLVHRLPGLNFGVRGLAQEYPYLPSLPALIEALNPDVVHVESHLFLTAFQAVKKANKLHLPCVVTVHGVLAERGIVANFAQNMYLRSLGTKVFRGANRVICLTKSNAAEIENYGCPSEKIRLVPNAVDTRLFKPNNEREDNLVVWVGRFVPEKGVEYLIKAANIILKKSCAFRLLLIGYGPLKPKITKMAKDLDLLHRFVTITGPMSREEIATILSKATIFAFPSLSEGMPVSVFEAMASGVPVVASYTAGVREIIVDRQNGILVPPKNPEVLAQAILSLLDDENQRRELGENARHLMIENYSWDTAIKGIEKVYHEAIAQAGQSKNFYR